MGLKKLLSTCHFWVLTDLSETQICESTWSDIGIGPKTDSVAGLSLVITKLWLRSSHSVAHHRSHLHMQWMQCCSLRETGCSMSVSQTYDRGEMNGQKNRCKCCSLWIGQSSGANTSRYRTDGCLIHWSMTGCMVDQAQFTLKPKAAMHRYAKKPIFNTIWSLHWEEESNFQQKTAKYLQNFNIYTVYCKTAHSLYKYRPVLVVNCSLLLFISPWFPTEVRWWHRFPEC